MDEKLRKSLTAIICDIVECTEPLDCDMASTCPYVIDGLPQLEQAFRDADWAEPKQPEGELVDYCMKVCQQPTPCPYFDNDKQCLAVAKAQRAFMLQQGWVKLPSEGELALMLDIVIPEGAFNFSTAAQELLGLLQEQGEQKP